MMQDDGKDVKDGGEDEDEGEGGGEGADASPPPPALFARERAHLPYHLAYEALDLLSDSTQKV